MKVQVCVVVVAAAVLVGAAPHKDAMEFWIDFMRLLTAGVCGPDLCWPASKPCFDALKHPVITTQEQLAEAKDNFTQCAETVGATDADFSALSFGFPNEGLSESHASHHQP
ncbi:hypothetical protein GWK47_019004 [Chionoecetes opilio]|uniref:Uncharacterized protein n=1 Tax=Chionoecetes opilio TaxID=41210 RepID=A0A8J4XSQ9_CHIOP|nr:hypothetical protein GWK47_019004 [Chionoecetes opilio]